LPPDEVMSKPPGVRAFMLASMCVQIEAENNVNAEGKGLK